MITSARDKKKMINLKNSLNDQLDRKGTTISQTYKKHQYHCPYHCFRPTFKKLSKVLRLIMVFKLRAVCRYIREGLHE